SPHNCLPVTVLGAPKFDSLTALCFSRYPCRTALNSSAVMLPSPSTSTIMEVDDVRHCLVPRYRCPVRRRHLPHGLALGVVKDSARAARAHGVSGSLGLELSRQCPVQSKLILLMRPG